ncbi:hypothetical protein FB45DRAFT_1029840 [Roridomyces roridus]|uniref:DUF6534 domain-containing protein n=1 Tax=Roridomyces roridus TaxID=1738132 RepID=A0AAD7BMP4_9AGAR|nr:hypothetical protein FB45DRAFT_1029840 [Roridomyces roridus]
MASGSSVIQLIPPSAAFVENRTTTLGTWVLAGFFDAILLGVVLCQVTTFFRYRTSSEGIGRYYRWLVLIVTFMSVLKTSQSIAIVWIQNVQDFMDPDVARTLVAKAWWQVSAPILTATTGIIVQSFFAIRFYMLARNVFFIIPIVCSMLLGYAGICLQLNSIIVGNVQAKITWLLVHLVCVFLTDLFITVGTCYALSGRNSGGLASTTSLIHRLLRLVFESAIPPTVAAFIDLIMSQTLGSAHLLWHLLFNYSLAKLYVISLLYTLNSINEYRDGISQDRTASSGSRGNNLRATKRGDVELGSVRPLAHKTDQVYVQTQIVTHVSPSVGSVEERPHEDVKTSGWQPMDWEK